MKTITLKHPVKLNGQEYKELRMRRWKVRDMRRSQASGLPEDEQEVRLFADLCEVSPDVIDELDGADWKQLTDTFKSFSA